jgi:hypothetical protein
MDAVRQYACHTIVYSAIAYELRSYGALCRWWNPFGLVRARRHLAYNSALADCIHNLAEFSRRDFDHFKEDWFGREYDAFKKQFPRGFDYRKRFDDELGRFDPNNR